MAYSPLVVNGYWIDQINLEVLYPFSFRPLTSSIDRIYLGRWGSWCMDSQCKRNNLWKETSKSESRQRYWLLEIFVSILSISIQDYGSTFRLDEMARYDLPAIIDKALMISGQDKVYYIGDSQGTLLSFLLLSDRPRYNNKVDERNTNQNNKDLWSRSNHYFSSHQ